MGGLGSGRPYSVCTSGRTDSLQLRAADLFGGQKLQPGMRMTGALRWASGFEVALMAELTESGGLLRVTHWTRDRAEEEITYWISLTATRPNFGRWRWRFLCPRTGARADKLFLPLGGRQFWSRAAYRLRYDVQSLSPLDRLHRRARRLRRKLGDDGDTCDPFPEKPKWMRWATYNRIADELATVEQEIDLTFSYSVARLLRLSLS